MASEHYQELLWDYLYGLLDATVAQSVRTHVETCSTCQTALTAAQSQQQLLACAARVIHDVPAFTAPGQAAETSPAPTSRDTTPATSVVAGPRRSLARRYWPVWAAAAALLAFAIGLNQLYQNGLYSRENQIAQVRAETATIEGRFAALRTDLEKETRQQARLLKEQTPLQLQMLGPAQVVSETAANFNVATRDATGQLRATTVTTSVIDPTNNTVLHQQTDRVEGQGHIQVPGVKMEHAQTRIVMKPRISSVAARSKNPCAWPSLSMPRTWPSTSRCITSATWCFFAP